jgi:arylsulfatase A-like enzyme/tetratricopeptide (TPR) repeat protein
VWIRAAVIGAAVAVGAWLAARGRHGDRPNLLLVTIDTLRADRVGAYGYALASTPTLDGIARRGVRFAKADSAVPLTGPSHSTILTGQYPPVHGVRDNVVFTLDAKHPTLATLLKAEDYRTAAFVAAYPVAGSFGFARGFDRFEEGFHETPVAGQGAERPANEVADAALGWLAQPASGPFFLWLHFYDPHAPYRPPAPWAGRFPGRPYDGEIAFTDGQLGRVLDGLRAAGHEEDTLVVVLSDHGESLGDHREATHAILVYESTLHVPWLMAGPGLVGGRVVDERVGTVDLLPTVLRLLDINPPAGLPGRDLGAAIRGERLSPEPLYAESLFGRLNCRWSSLRAWTVGDWKLVEGGRSELFNLAEDPAESRDLAATEPMRVRRMREALQAALRRMAPGGDRARTVSISAEQEDKLRSLGYTAGTGGGGALDDPRLPDPRERVHLYERLQSDMLARGPAAAAALADMQEVLRIDGGNPYAHFALGHLAYREGRLALAAGAYARGLEIDPDRPGVRLSYGRLLREMGRLEDSERQLRIALGQTATDDDRTRIALAETLIARGTLGEAETLLAPVLERSPNHVEALAARAHLLAALGRGAEAVAVLERLGRGGDPEPWIELARLQLSLGDAGQAAESAARALERSPEHPWALAVRGHALIAEGRRSDGLALLRRALAAHPRRPQAWLSLAGAFEAAGERAHAEACRREANAISG